MDSAPVTAIVPVYTGDNPGHFAAALDSLENQTHPPAETIVIADGPLTDALDGVLAMHDGIDTIRLETNQGQGRARAAGVRRGGHDLVAFLDADDLAAPERFERQAARFARDDDLDALGGAICEFADSPSDPHARRAPPTDPGDVRRYARFRSPINNTTAMVRRESLIDAGNYRAEEPFEDYRLWLRMLDADMTLANLDDVLGHVRVDNGDGMTARRGGWDYAKAEIRMFADLHAENVVSGRDALANLAVRLPVRLVPDGLRRAVYGRLLRD